MSKVIRKRHQNVRLHNDCRPTKDSKLAKQQLAHCCGLLMCGSNLPTPHSSCAILKDI